MSEWLIQGVKVTAQEGISYDEALCHAVELLREFAEKRKLLLSVDMRLSEDQRDVICECKEKSPIKRIRRITGYLSEDKNFNAGKAAELADRSKHPWRAGL